MLFRCALPAILLTGAVAIAQQSASSQEEETLKIPLVVEKGVPLRLYLTQRFSKKPGAPVHAKIMDPVYVFDREVIAAGSEVLGTVSDLRPAPKWKRVQSILKGDFTPQQSADVRFTTLIMPDGKRLAVDTAPAASMLSIYREPRPKKNKDEPKRSENTAKHDNPDQNTGVLGLVKYQIKYQMDARINSATRDLGDIVRGPDRRELLEELAWSKLPYHPQWVRKGTRFDAELLTPLPLGTAEVTPDELRFLGTAVTGDDVVRARLVTELNSAQNKPGDTAEAILSEPLFSADRFLILPAGTHVTGRVTVSQPARYFHRGGKLRFAFQNVQVPREFAPSLVPPTKAPLRPLATLAGAEASGAAKLKVDNEGEVRATESKERLLAPAVAALIAMKSLDNDAGKEAHGGGDGNTTGRSLGGVSGFGWAGFAASQASPSVGTALGFYGLGWSVFKNVVARGGEVEFNRNALVDIRFGTRPSLDSPAKPYHPPSAEDNSADASTTN